MLDFDETDLKALADWDMPFGRFAGKAIIDLPEDYLFWFERKGWPRGRLGRLMQLALQLKIDGLENLVKASRDQEAMQRILDNAEKANPPIDEPD